MVDADTANSIKIYLFDFSLFRQDARSPRR